MLGEWYTCIAHEINYDIFNKLKQMNVNVHYADCATLTGFLMHQIHLDRLPREYINEGKKYYGAEIQAHGKYSLWNMFFYKAKNFDAIFHFMPLSCMPESTAQMMMDLTTKRLRLPLYRFEIDETNSEANINTRLEAFVELLQENKGKRESSRRVEP